jgi:hypothetical protein
MPAKKCPIGHLGHFFGLFVIIKGVRVLVWTNTNSPCRYYVTSCCFLITTVIRTVIPKDSFSRLDLHDALTTNQLEQESQSTIEGQTMDSKLTILFLCVVRRDPCPLSSSSRHPPIDRGSIRTTNVAAIRLAPLPLSRQERESSVSFVEALTRRKADKGRNRLA